MLGRALSIFEEVVDLAGQEREARLAERCEGDKKLIAEVQALLTSDASAGDFLEPESLDTLLDDMPRPEHIGPYRITDELGEGGFGVVYLAEQQEPIQRSVALKLIKPGMDSRRVLRRFAEERRTLARLEHPNIARVLDSGITQDNGPQAGRPYFVMELVKGEPITTFADRHGLVLEARLALVLQAAAGIQHAHALGIIHRDLKPANILVAESPEGPVCKIIDFGIAKVLHPAGAPAEEMTQTGAIIGTPQYMSPEQAGGSQAVDIRSDVYALGAVLYELLCGVPPINPDTLRSSSPEELRQAMAASQIKAPSARALERKNAEDAIPLPIPFAGRVRGELDWITLHAMAREPERRYETIAAFAEDIRRWTRFEPVAAGPPSTLYRFSKFVSRNRGAVVAAVTIAAVLVVAGALIVRASITTERARAAEQEARIRAEVNADRLAGINSFLTDDLFFSVDPERLGRDATVYELLTAAAPRIDTRFAGDDPMRSLLHARLGTMYSRVYEFGPAMHHLDRAIDIARSAPDVEKVTLSDLLFSRSQETLAAGNPEKAEADIREAIALLESSDAGKRRRMLARGQLGRVLSATGQTEDADTLLAEAIDYFSQDTTTLDANLSSLIMERLQIAWRTRRSADVERLAKLIMRLSDDDPSRGAMISRVAAQYWLALMLKQTGRFEEAASVAVALVPLASEYGGEISPMHAMATVAAGQTLSADGRHDEAIPYLDKSFDLMKQVFSPYHFEVERHANLIAKCHLEAGDEDGFRDYRLRALLQRLYNAGPGERDSVIAATDDAAQLLSSRHAWADTVLAEIERTPPGHYKRARYLGNAIASLAAAGHTEAANELLTQAEQALKDSDALDQDRVIVTRERSHLAGNP